MTSTGSGCGPGDRVLDMGCGAGRHAFEMYRRGADVIAFDMDADELAGVLDLFGAMKEAGEVPEGAEADIKQGDALALPFADGEFDRVVAAEVLEHIHADIQAIEELVRVLRPGGTLAVSVPRWLPEIINWKLSDDYHNAEGGHIRIYTDHELIDKVTKAAFTTAGDAMSRGQGLRPRPARAVLVDQVRGRRRQRRPPAREGLPPAAGLGDHEAAQGAAARRQGARPADRQEHGALLPQAARPAAPDAGRLAPLPYVDGVLSAEQVAETAASIAAMQEPCGAVPWTVGEHVDIWNHVEAAMAMLVGGQVEAAERAYAWMPDDAARRRLVADEDRRRRGRGRARRGQHVGLPRGRALAPLAGAPRHRLRRSATGRRCGPGSTGWSPSRSPFGGIRWTPTEDFCLLAGSSSIYQSLRAGVALADLLDDPQPEWELAGGRLGHAVREHRDLFADKSTYSMDWYYPVLGGAVRGRAAFELLDAAVGRLRRARPRHPLRRHQPVGHRRRDLRARDGAGHAGRPPPGAARCSPTCSTCAARTASTGPAGSTRDGRTDGVPRDVHWPVEHTTYTAAAVILAVDALGETYGHSTPGLGHHARHLAGAALRARSRWSAAAPQPTSGSPGFAACTVTRAAPASSPRASTSSKAPDVERPQEDVVRRPPAVRGVREHVVDRRAARRSSATCAQPV